MDKELVAHIVEHVKLANGATAPTASSKFRAQLRCCGWNYGCTNISCSLVGR